jgi:3-phosphoshikimate 1-carboxyvinyltransferase
MKRRRSDPSAPLRGTVSVPGDKSISHRALMLAALAEGSSVVRNLNLGSDVRWTSECLASLGVSVALDEANAKVDVESPGLAALEEPEDVLFAGNSGTAVRLLSGICASIEGVSVLSGDESVRTRPMLRVVSPLRQMGADIDGRKHGDRAPLVIRGRDLHGIDLEMPVASAQVKSAVLLAGLAAAGATSVTEPGQSRDHTERMLAAAGVEVRSEPGRVSVPGGERPAPMRWEVPGDASSAAFLVVGALLLEGSDLKITGVGLNPTRTAYLGVLERMGAELTIEVTHEACGEPVGDITVRSSKLLAVEIGGAEIPRLIDEIPVLAVAAACAEGTTVIKDASELRVKESDRVDAMTQGLSALGATVEPTRDGIDITGPSDLVGGAVESRGDHRVALALAVAGLVADGNVRIEGWSCINTSFPEFLDVLAEARNKPRNKR